MTRSFGLLLTVSVFIAAFLVAVHGPSAPGEPGYVNGVLPESEVFESLRQYNAERAYPAGRIPLGWREKAMAQIDEMNLAKRSAGVSSINWQSVGPTTIGGRVRSIALDTLNHILYAGSVSGGIWKSTDAGTTWSELGDAAVNMCIGAITLDPSNPSIMYAGTGEGYFNVDALRGAGILKSTNGGATWSVLNNFVGAAAPVVFINKIVIRPDNPAVLYAAVSSVDVGVWKSTDAGASWAKLQAAGGNTNSASLKFCTDLVMDPTSPNTLYGAFGLFNTNGVWKTTDGGTTWSRLSNGFPAQSTKYLRISLALAPSDPQTLYACLADTNYNTHSIQKSTDGGASWSAVGTPFDSDPSVNATHLGGQGWYNNVIAVSPADPNVVITGGINVFRSTNGGTGWSRISDGYAGGIHVDQHAVLFDPTNPLTIYFGNDGGMFKTLTGGTSFVDCNAGFVTTQFYSASVHPSSEIYYGGTQDNGTLKQTAPGAWTQVFGGDGGYTAVDQTTPTTVFTEYVYLDILKSTNSGQSFNKSMAGIPGGSGIQNGTSDRVLFIAPFVMDPSNSQILVAGTYRIFRTTNGGGSWSAISTDLGGSGAGSTNSTGAVVSSIAVAPSSSPTIYAGTTGGAGGSDTASPRIWVTTNANAATPAWTNLTRSPLPRRVVKALAVDRNDATIVVAGYSGFNASTPSTPGHVFRSLNAGGSWSNISGNLPDVPVNSIILDPANNAHILAGTDLGVFESTDAGTTWLPQNSGLANVSIADLDLRPDGYVFAASHGRGLFKSTLPFGISATSALGIIIHQNTVASAYLDLFVTTAESLASAPTLSLTLGTTVQIPLAAHANRIYKGTYQLTSGGTGTLSASAHDSTGQSIGASRLFQASLLKPGTGGSIAPAQGGAAAARLIVGRDALASETWFTAVNGPGVIGDAATFGPAAGFNAPLTVAFTYDEATAAAGDPRHLTILVSDGDAWAPVASVVDPAKREVRAEVTGLGTFALGRRDDVVSQRVPQQFRLEQNYPNPFNPSTTIRFALPSDGTVSLDIFDAAGRRVATIAEGNRTAGEYEAVWDGRTSSGGGAASGMYFYRLTVRSNVSTYSAAGKMVYLK